MAKPPEPLEEILPLTSLIVDGEVKEVRSTDQDDDPNGPDSPRQIVVLSVKRLVHGALTEAEKKSNEIVATKPKAPYVLLQGTKGPYLLTTDRSILGRYGPDSWRMEKVEQKLKG
jgi:hypothetical protein